MRTAATTSLTLQCAPQGEMGRYRGVGMPKAKKKKIQQPEDAGPSQPQPVSAAAMPPPPPSSEAAQASRRASASTTA